MSVVKEIIDRERKRMFANVLAEIVEMGFDVALLFKERRDEMVSVSIVNANPKNKKIKKYLSQVMSISDMLDLAKEYNISVFRQSEIIEEIDR